MSALNPSNLMQMVERLFEHVLAVPSGYSYVKHRGKLFLPVAGKDEWRLMLKDLATGETHPIFLTSQFLDNLTRALAATQMEFDKSVPERVIQ